MLSGGPVFESETSACVAFALSEPFDDTLGAWSESHFASVWDDLQPCAAEYDRVVGGECAWKVGWCHPGHWDHVSGTLRDNPLSFVGLVSAFTKSDEKALRRKMLLPGKVVLGVSLRTRRLTLEPTAASNLRDYARYIVLDEPVDAWLGSSSDAGDWLEVARVAASVARGELSESQLRDRVARSRDRWSAEGYQVVLEAVARIAGSPR